MATTPFLLTVRGVRDNPAVTEVNIRSGPGTGNGVLFRVPVGMSKIPVLDVKPDAGNTAFQGKVYQWLQASFGPNQTGWVRDDLVDVQGDGSRFGYGVLPLPARAFDLTRGASANLPTQPPPPPAPAKRTFVVGGASVRVRSVPSASGALVRELPSGTQLEVEANSRTVAEGFVWWKHREGWSVERRADDSQVFMAPPAAPGPAPLPPTPAPPTPPVQPPDDNPLRVQRAAFAITHAFEGGGYATYQSFDSGIISYGRFQFTLSAGNLLTVLNRYLERSSTPVANEVRGYMPRLQAKDETLRQDARLKELLIAAAQEQVMKDVQDEVATEGFYKPVMETSINPRGLLLPLTHALIFDMAIHHGRFNHLIPKAEQELGVPSRSRVGDNGITEKQFVQKLVQLRQQNLNALADKLRLGGLKRRGEFWVNLVNAGDWFLQGDANGNVNINGKIVQVRNP
ncbi:MAG TPA: chitosanase [Aggregatilineales bacterium]|nr:chitosanase [Aggregatilineales bacterium]